MRRLVVLGIAVVAGCGAGGAGPETGPADGFWRSVDHRWDHELTLSAGRYEAGDRDAVGICRSSGDFLVDGASVQLHRDSAPCADELLVLTLVGDQLLTDSRVYVRADPTVHETDFEPPPAQR